MKKSAQNKLDGGIIMGSSIISGILVSTAVKKVRQKMEKRKMKKKKIYEAPWPNALKWTLATSLASGFAGLLIKRYSSKGLKRIKA